MQLVILEVAEQRLHTLELLARDMVNYSNAPSTNANKKSHEKRYMEFCNWLEIDPFPVTEWRLVLFGTYLSLTMSTVDSIKSCCCTIAELHELKGLGKVYRGKLYNKAMQGIRRLLQHKTQRVQPVTIDMLLKMVEFIDVDDQKMLATWVCLLVGWFLFLRKSNLVPVSRQHDPEHQISRQDIKIHENVIVSQIKWSKTNQFGQESIPIPVPVIRKEGSPICPVEWLLFMVNRIPALGFHNLFCFHEHSQVKLVTYRDLTELLRDLLSKIGIQDTHRYSSHSLRRGGTTHAFNKKIPELLIQKMGMWASMAYRKYIDITLENRLKAWLLMSE